MEQDERAVSRVVSGDSEAFRSLVERHQSAVCATIRAILPQYSEWEDLAQDVFLAAFQHLATFDATKGTFRVWLMSIARNQCRRVRQRRPATDLSDMPGIAAGPAPEELACETELFERLDVALAALPEEKRLAFVFVEMQGLSYQEAANVCEVAVGTLKSRLFRAKEWLREALSPRKENAPTDGLAIPPIRC